MIGTFHPIGFMKLAIYSAGSAFFALRAYDAYGFSLLNSFLAGVAFSATIGVIDGVACSAIDDLRNPTTLLIAKATWLPERFRAWVVAKHLQYVERLLEDMTIEERESVRRHLDANPDKKRTLSDFADRINKARSTSVNS
jgi:hypothetical protein